MGAESQADRWYQFSLGKMLIATTFICVWLGYELNWLRQRHAIIKDSEFSLEDAGPRAAPGLLWLFGETGYREIHPRYYTLDWWPMFTQQMAEEQRRERNRIRALFPEVDKIELELRPPKLDDDAAEVRIERIGERLDEIWANWGSRTKERYKLRDERRILERQLGRPLSDLPPPPRLDDADAEKRIAQIGEQLAEMYDNLENRTQELRDERRNLERQLGRPLTDLPAPPKDD